MMRVHSCNKLHPDVIDVPEGRLRQLDENKVAEIATSIEAIGLINPIIVRDRDRDGSVITLVAGRHRLAAAKRLGMEEIDCVIVEGDDVECRLLEISENLHRAELTLDERREHIVEWIRLTEERRKVIPAQLAPKSKSESNPKGAGRPESGINAAVRELGIDRTEAQRAVKIASITPEAREAAKAAGLNSQAALLKIASYGDDEQVEAVAAIAAEKAAPKPTKPTYDLASPPDLGPIREEAAPAKPDLMSAWAAASEAERLEFVGKLGDTIVAALTSDQLALAHRVHNRTAEKVRRQTRDLEEAERVKALDRARQSQRHAQRRRAA
jgi:ParB/RepB/Spo0J family partition protein